jgi:carboxypeptidase PM20D1
MIFANLWAFGWVVDLLGKKTGGELNALVRTTVAFTQMKGSSAPNVIPPEAHLVSNIRVNPCDSVEKVYNHIKKTVANENITLTKLTFSEPSRISRVDCPEYEAVAGAVATTWPEAIVSPYLMVQCSDSRHYGRVSDRVYRFSAMALTSEERRSIHGNNEKIRIESVHKSCEFYLNLIKKL